MLKLTQIVRRDAKNMALDIDVNCLGATAIVFEDDQGMRSAVVDQRTWFSWRADESPHGRHLRWIGTEKLGIWSFAKSGSPCGILSIDPSDRKRLPILTPSRVFSGRRTLFVCYGEDQNILAKTSDIEWNIVASVDFEGRFVFGLGEHLRAEDFPGTPLEVTVACVTEKDELLFVISGCENLWRMNPISRILQQIPFPSDVVPRITALCSVKDDIIFTVNEAGRLVVSAFNPVEQKVSRLGDISYDELFGDASSRRNPGSLVRLHGTTAGTILAVAESNLWSIEGSH
ncbi:hypothetical protein [Bradyrhizobium yuanmingense]|uniref:hypothetical protein n=1 Tax=Bradyrhizobium yuanmingense TaxID=108015 RepID=UPI0023B9805A|nr:hypothetical protein [Bradyrhizobium yuanmingense]MDF0584145.1 hypothetical protein [Bradyrhizobium yuanmingense]